MNKRRRRLAGLLRKHGTTRPKPPMYLVMPGGRHVKVKPGRTLTIVVGKPRPDTAADEGKP